MLEPKLEFGRLSVWRAVGTNDLHTGKASRQVVLDAREHIRRRAEKKMAKLVLGACVEHLVEEVSAPYPVVASMLVPVDQAICERE